MTTWSFSIPQNGRVGLPGYWGDWAWPRRCIPWALATEGWVRRCSRYNPLRGKKIPRGNAVFVRGSHPPVRYSLDWHFVGSLDEVPAGSARLDLTGREWPGSSMVSDKEAQLPLDASSPSE